MKKYFGIPSTHLIKKMKLVHEYQAKDGFYFQIEYRNNIYNVHISHEYYGTKMHCFGSANELKEIEIMLEANKNDYIDLYKELYIE